jgi:hypothetical protein
VGLFYFMPLVGQHACRLRDPDDFKSNSFRTIDQESEGKPIRVLIGELKGEDTTTAQSIRYPTGSWSESQARDH